MTRGRAWRRAQRRRVIANRTRTLRVYEYEHLLAQPGRFAVKHPLDCGKRCLMCHGDKLLGLRPKREVVEAKAALREARA